MTQPHISVIDWAFKTFLQNYTNETECRCKIGKIKIGRVEIDPNMFNKKKGVWS